MKKKLTSTLSQFFSPTGSKDKNVTRPIINASPLVVFVRVDVRPPPPPSSSPPVCVWPSLTKLLHTLFSRGGGLLVCSSRSTKPEQDAHFDPKAGKQEAVEEEVAAGRLISDGEQLSHAAAGAGWPRWFMMWKRR